MLPGATAVAVGGAAEVGGIRVTGGGAAVLQGELWPAPAIIPHAPGADRACDAGGPGDIGVREHQGAGGGRGDRVGGDVNIVTIPTTVTIGLTTRGERGTRQQQLTL